MHTRPPAPPCGLLVVSNPSVSAPAVPLEGVRIEAHVSGLTSRVTVTQRYHNREAVDVEAVYVFPLPSDAAVCGLTVRTAKATWVGRAQERERAFETYDDALMDGHGAVLVDQERPNVFTASVGNLKADSRVEVSLTYVAQLQPEGDAVRLMIPTTVSPRYSPGASADARIGQPDHERVNPPRWSQVPYGLTLTVHIDTQGRPLASLESPSHTVRTRFEADHAKVELSQSDVALDRDVILNIAHQSGHTPFAQVGRDAHGSRFAMVTFCPSADDLPMAPSEVFFVLDCSGSMRGSSIEEARRALALCLRALSEGDTFNIICFGSTHRSLWRAPKPYTQTSLDEATAHVQKIQASMGGTEILRPLQEIVSRPVDPSRARQVLLLTDGQVSNEPQVIDLCARNAANTRVFSFGIGAGVSEHLVREVARVSRGAAEFIYPGERIEPKVLRQFQRVATPALTDVRVDWGGLDVTGGRASTPPVFAGEALTVFGRVEGGHAESVTLHSAERTWTVPIDLERAVVDTGIPELWARHRIRALEDRLEGRGGTRGSNQRRPEREARTKTALIELATRYTLMSSLTSLVAVELRDEADRTQGPTELRRIPSALTSGWGGHGQKAQARTLSGGGNVMASLQSIPATSAFDSVARMAPVAGAAPPRMDSMEMERGMPRPAAKKRSRRRAKFGGLPPAPQAAAPPMPARRPAPAPPGMAPPSAPAPGGYAPPPAPAPASMGSRGKGAAFGGGGGGLGGGADALFDLLMTQRADGAFTLSPALKALLSPSAIANLDAQAAQDGDQRVATSAAVRLLKQRFADRSDEWGLAVTKAERWLARNGGAVQVQL